MQTHKKLLGLLMAVSLAFIAGDSRAAGKPTANDLLRLLPDGSGLVIVDMARVTHSPVWEVLSTQETVKREIAKLEGEIADLGVSLGDIETLTLAFPNSPAGHPTIAVAGSFDQTTLVGRLRMNQKVKVSSEDYHGFEVFIVTPVRTDAAGSTGVSKGAGTRAGEPVSFTFFDSRSTVLGSRESVRDSIDVKLGTRPSIGDNATLMQAMSENMDAPIRLAVALTPDMTGKLQTSDLPLPDFKSIKLVLAGIDLSSGVDIKATLRNDTADHAKNVADSLNGLLGMVRGFLGVSNDAKLAGAAEALKTVIITNADVDVKISGSVSVDLIKSFLNSGAVPKKP